MARDGDTGDAHPTGAVWRATAEALAREVATLRHRLVTVERALGLPTPPDAPDPRRCQCGLAGRDTGGHGLVAPLPRGSPARCGCLSRRELEVLGLLARGRSNREIAAALSLSPRTVQRHIANLYPKIGAHNKADATAYALRHCLG